MLEQVNDTTTIENSKTSSMQGNSILISIQSIHLPMLE